MDLLVNQWQNLSQNKFKPDGCLAPTRFFKFSSENGTFMLSIFTYARFFGCSSFQSLTKRMASKFFWKCIMDVKIAGKLINNVAELVDEVNKLVENADGPIRRELEIDSSGGRAIVHFRVRTIGEYLLEKIFYSAQKIEAIKNECRSSIAHVMSPLIHSAIAEEASVGKREAVVDQGGSRTLNGRAEPAILGLSNSDNSVGNDMDNDSLHQTSRLISENSKKLRACFERLDNKVFRKTKQSKSLIPTAKSRLGLFQVPEGLNVSLCPPLQFVSNNVIVSSVGAQAKNFVSGHSPLKRALKAFVKTWKDFIRNEKFPSQIYGELPSSSGLRHIEHLWCLGDNSERTRNRNHQEFNDQSLENWKNFYLELLAPMRGTVVLQLYPDFYHSDLSTVSAMTPYFSENNIAGAVNAAILMNSKSRKDAMPPVSIMFAGVNATVANAIAENIRSQSSEVDYVTPNQALLQAITKGMKEIASAKKQKFLYRHTGFNAEREENLPDSGRESAGSSSSEKNEATRNQPLLEVDGE